MDFVDCIPKNNINFRIILQKICTMHKKVVPLHEKSCKKGITTMPCPYNNIECPCTKEGCPRHAHCCACVAHHKAHGTKLPACLRGIEW